MNNLVACIILADRKAYSQLSAIPALLSSPFVERVYVNIETNNPDLYPALYALAERSGKPIDIDTWWWRSTWRPTPKYDQDQKRLIGIVTARNMCIDYALYHNAQRLLFVDSDVIIEPQGLQFLLEMDKNLSGGYVPGRGAHGSVCYVFGQRRGIHQHGDIIECDHGTCGYMLISQKVFSALRFRYGDDPEGLTGFLSEDPAYCIDWYKISGERFYIHTKARAAHIDSPSSPLSNESVSIDKWETLRD